MDDDTILIVLCNELREIFIEVVNHVRADLMSALASLTPIGNGLECEGTAFQAALAVVV